MEKDEEDVWEVREMVLFSQRMQIEKAFNDWTRINHVARVPSSVVAFLEINGCLDEEAIHKAFPVEEKSNETN